MDAKKKFNIDCEKIILAIKEYNDSEISEGKRITAGIKETAFYLLEKYRKFLLSNRGFQH